MKKKLKNKKIKVLWVTAVWEAHDEALCSFEHFQELFCHIFEHSPEEDEANEHLHTISQNNHIAAVCAPEFQTLAAGSCCNEPVLKAMFCHRINEVVLTGMMCQDEIMSLDSLIDLAIRLNNLLRKRPALCTQAALPELITAAEPMQLHTP